MRLRYLVLWVAAIPMLASADGFSGIRTIKTVHVEGPYFARIIATSPFDNPDGCGSSTGVLIRNVDAQYKDALAAAMLAFATGQPVKFYTTGCAATSWGYTEPVVFSISVNP